MASQQKRFSWILIAALSVALSACAALEDEERVEDPDQTTEETEERERAAEEEGRETAVWAMEDRDALEGEELDMALEDPDSPIAKRTVHFDFDSSEVREEDMPILESHGEFLADHPAQQITVEGHTDERGSREYNLALGERRAEAVKRILVLNGAGEDQLEIVSYGEENPVASGSSEEDYEQNRRAELVYRR